VDILVANTIYAIMTASLVVWMLSNVTIVKDPMEVLVTSLIILRPSRCPTPHVSVKPNKGKPTVPVNISVPESKEYSDRITILLSRWRVVHAFLMKSFTLSKTFVIVLNTH